MYAAALATSVVFEKPNPLSMPIGRPVTSLWTIGIAHAPEAQPHIPQTHDVRGQPTAPAVHSECSASILASTYASSRTFATGPTRTGRSSAETENRKRARVDQMPAVARRHVSRTDDGLVLVWIVIRSASSWISEIDDDVKTTRRLRGQEHVVLVIVNHEIGHPAGHGRDANLLCSKLPQQLLADEACSSYHGDVQRGVRHSTVHPEAQFGQRSVAPRRRLGCASA